MSRSASSKRGVCAVVEDGVGTQVTEDGVKGFVTCLDDAGGRVELVNGVARW